MTIDPELLLNFPIPDIRQRVTPRDVAFYALSVGMAQDPTDPRQLDFVDQHRQLHALPWMALVLGHPGFWLTDPRIGVDAVRLVHGEQALEQHLPLPVEGEIVGRTRVTGLVDKGAGRGALLYMEKQVLDAASGALYATARSTTFLRGDGGFGGPTGPVRRPPPVPGGPPDFVVELPTRPEQALFYRLNGDDNPLHADPAVAAAAGFERPILHGLCTLGVVAHALLRTLGDYDATRFRELQLRFTAPVLPGETIRTEIWRDGSFRARVAERNVMIVNHGLARFAEAGASP
ncbi:MULTISPECIES: MaoC/PaaZ C-terminal domain-containing protein [Acidiphilium]|uniref:Enoyl-CoA hydratase n=1 Tax=Acidiphilium multivorum (strain DSM 11245 / JCM 8867 / NBRC 100883 / AIU 301) TaxID=926570 RepID=F0J4B1_ACIMA|nr:MULTISPECIES: MaoC/PaaZ C-terminal domain-containing protein [Acidiphilium]MBU6357028.1 MaoC family dehydratase N-terminal domain-containing protein [Rhodospirillales bacterium]EGO95696.1 3-alpha,7-alpha,12-alpha-trihydroxy-5-beta-cholest-24-enoyl-CoAhydratase [Acidiphilium sp. PM]MBS3023053.1 MaoC family dehydratase N-terminal domain-containing protein [Acidiphilium multivorum]MDE2327415.1 MaoC family dehydratase N-terminal domain-containing protein [Rhodospirillales bacterium]UNC14206.1 3